MKSLVTFLAAAISIPTFSAEPLTSGQADAATASPADAEASASFRWFRVAPHTPNRVAFTARPARFVRLMILESEQGQPCIDELEVYGPAGAANLALARGGAKARASSCLAGYPIHQVSHLNDGQ